MSKILIRGLKVEACHGVKDFEKVEKQPFIFDADIYYDFFPAYLSDNLNDTINYSAASKLIVKVATQNTFDLIEKLAYECAYSVMNELPANKISLTVYKPHAPMKLDFDTVGVNVEVERTTAYLSLGSSLGDRRGYIDKAIRLLGSKPYIKVKKASDYMETKPYGGVAQNTFINCAVEIETLYSPRRLLNVIHEIEAECGRVRNKHWEDRTLDIDIVFFGKKVVYEDDLIIPHPDYKNREFVLAPLKQIAPNFICPVSHKAIKDIMINE